MYICVDVHMCGCTYVAPAPGTSHRNYCRRRSSCIKKEEGTALKALIFNNEGIEHMYIQMHDTHVLV
jgi:hypothetical protein